MENNLFNTGKGEKIPLYPNEAYQSEPNANIGNNMNINSLLPLLLSGMQGGGAPNDAISKLISQSGMEKNPLLQMFSTLNTKKKGSSNELPIDKEFPKNEPYS